MDLSKLKGELASYKAGVLAKLLGISLEEARELKSRGVPTTGAPKVKPETKKGATNVSN